MKISFAGEAYTLPSVNVDSQNCINWFLVADQKGKYPSQFKLFPDPGFEMLSAQVGTQYNVRELYKLNNAFYAVIDSGFYQVFKDGDRRSLGTLKTSVGKLIILANDTQIYMSDGVHEYVYQLKKTTLYDADEFVEITATSSQIGDPTFVGTGLDDLATTGEYTGTDEKTYRVEIQTLGSPDKFRWSDSNGVTWNVENIAISEGDVDLNEGVKISFGNLTGHTIGDYWTFQVTVQDTAYAPKRPTYQEGYGVFPRQGTSQFFISEIGDFRKRNALDFAFADAEPSNIVASISMREEIWHLCEDSSEVWYNTGGATFPFERRPNLLLSYGCAAAFSVKLVDNNVLVWLAKNPEGKLCVVKMDGYEPVVISNEALNAEFSTYQTIDDAEATVYCWQGHTFYVLTFPTEDRTWALDITTGKLHEKRSYFPNEAPQNEEYRLGRWRISCSAFFDNKQVVGDFENGNIYFLSKDSYTENGNMLVCERTVQHLNDENNRIFCNWLIVDFESGVGAVTGADSDPQVMLSISKDDGHSWNGETWRSLGKLGEYKRRAKWNRQGYARDWVFKIRITASVWRVLVGASADMEASSE